MGKKIVLVLAFIITLLLGFVGGYFVATKTSFSFGNNNKLAGVWSSGNNYMVIEEDGTFYMLSIGTVYVDYDTYGNPTSDPISVIYSASTGHINKDYSIVYTRKYSNYSAYDTYNMSDEEKSRLKLATPLDQLNYQDYATNSSIKVIDDTTIEVNGNYTFLKKADEVSMNFHDFVD